MDPMIDMTQIMQRQPVINIGMIGHVANGKSSITKALSSKTTQQFTKEKETNKTLRLGYANVKIWRCDDCDAPEKFSSSDSSFMEKKCIYCKGDLKLIMHISIVDCPGHSDLTRVMMNGASVMDGACLVESGNNDSIPAPQTIEHMVAVRSANIPIITILLNKIDLIMRDKAYEQIEKIMEYIESETNIGSNIRQIIPVSATFGTNIDVLCHRLSMLKISKERDPFGQFKMITIRSFDINKPGCDLTKLCGGVIGGSIMKGMLKVGDQIYIYPGMTKRIAESEKEHQGPDFKYEPIVGTVLSIKSEMNELDYAIAGGLLGIQLTIDPAFSRNDHLAGSLVVKGDNKTIKVYDKIIIKMTTLLIEEDELKKIMKDSKEDNKLIININSNNINCKVYKYNKKEKEIFLFLDNPIAIDDIDRFATIVNKNTNDIVGRGIIIDGIECLKI
jgi:translation initiation factor 2 subunit 3